MQARQIHSMHACSSHIQAVYAHSVHIHDTHIHAMHIHAACTKDMHAHAVNAQAMTQDLIATCCCGVCHDHVRFKNKHTICNSVISFFLNCRGKMSSHKLRQTCTSKQEQFIMNVNFLYQSQRNLPESWEYSRRRHECLSIPIPCLWSTEITSPIFTCQMLYLLLSFPPWE